MKTTFKRKINETKLSKKEKAILLHLVECGFSLSNIVYNLAQDEDIKVWHPTMKRWVKEWDNAQNEASKVISKLNK